jgi:spermidine/putrescine transport system ATP-binding protein
MTETAPAIEARDLVRVFAGAVRALDGVSLRIEPNEFFTLLGPSGCGKTTLLRAIAGLETLDAGSITLYGQKLDGWPPWRRPVNTVFQSYAIFPHLTVAENIAFGLEMQNQPRRRIAERVAEMLALVQLEGLGGRRSAQLSGGQQQRVALARALATSPRVLLLDEPLSALDLKLRTEMQLELKRLQAQVGITFVFVTHDQHEALTMSDRIAVMRAGRVMQLGTPQDIYDRPANRFVADFIGETNLLEATGTGDGRFLLPGGATIHAAATATGNVALTVRPERLRLAADAGGLRGVIEQAVYLGTDTTYHVRIAGGERLRVRIQNSEGLAPRLAPGDAVGVVVPTEAVRVLTE